MIREYIRSAPIKDILEEHIEEAAFMYNCRLRAFIDPERSWEDLENYEKRMIPHLHGLALGGFDSATLLRDKLALDEDGDPGETFVAAVVYPMLDFIEPMNWLIEAVAQNPPHLRAIIDGLNFSCGPESDEWLEYFIGHENPTVRAVGAEVIGYCGLTNLQEKIVLLQDDPDPHTSLAAMYSLLGWGIKPTKERLIPFLNIPDSTLLLKVIELLLIIGDPDAISICRERSKTSEPAINQKLVFFLSISGTIDDVQIINEIIQKQPEITTSCFLALGLCGNIVSMDFLIDHLDKIDDIETFTAAYQALRLITGVDYLPQFEPDEVVPEEILKYQLLWENWWEQNQSKFSGELKWRRGEKLSPLVLLKDLLWAGNPCRDWTYREMIIRYGCPLNFQYDQFYDVQVQQMRELKQWTDKANSKFKPGLAYYHGRPLN